MQSKLSSTYIDLIYCNYSSVPSKHVAPNKHAGRKFGRNLMIVKGGMFSDKLAGPVGISLKKDRN